MTADEARALRKIASRLRARAALTAQMRDDARPGPFRSTLNERATLNQSSADFIDLFVERQEMRDRVAGETTDLKTMVAAE